MTDAQPTIIERARQGDAQAIAQLITQALTDRGIVAWGQWQDTTLDLRLEADTAIDQRWAVARVQRGLRRLGLTCPVTAVWLSGRRRSQTAIDWRERFTLTEVERTPRATATVPPPELPPTTSGPVARAALPGTTLAALAHVAPLISYLVVGGQWLGGWPLFWGGSFLLPWRVVAPLVVLLVRGAGAGAGANAVSGTDLLLQHQAKAALNFQLTLLIAWVVTIILMVVLVGFLLVVPLALFEIVSCIVATVRANEGKPVRYGGAFPFIR